MTENYVWYLAYGSNINLIRFLYYIKGGTLNGKSYTVKLPSKPMPIANRRVKLPYSLILNKWAYISKNKTSDILYGRMYKITKEQLSEVVRLESYQEVKLGMYDNLEVFSVNVLGKENKSVYQDYKTLLIYSLKELYKDSIDSYIKNLVDFPECGISGRYQNITSEGILFDRKEIELHNIIQLNEEAMNEPVVEIDLE